MLVNSNQQTKRNDWRDGLDVSRASILPQRMRCPFALEDAAVTPQVLE